MSKGSLLVSVDKRIRSVGVRTGLVFIKSLVPPDSKGKRSSKGGIPDLDRLEILVVIAIAV